MKEKNEKVFLQPTKEFVMVYFQWLLVVLVSFFVIYYSSNSFAASQSNHYHMYMNWELSIPLFPPMIIVYTTYVFMFVLIPFVFRTLVAYRALAYSMLITIGVSGVIFILFPGHLGFVRQDFVPGYHIWFSILHAIDQPHNLFPSLHVTFACICVLTMIQQTTNAIFHFALKTWLLLVCISVVLVHQHHIFDILCGIALGWTIYKLIFIRMVESIEASTATSWTTVAKKR